MQSRFAIVLMSVAGAGLLFCAGLVFGLGVMSSPKGGQHKEIAVTSEPAKVARRETTSSGDPSRPLTPLTPVHPGTSASAQAVEARQPQATAPAPPAPAPSTQVSAEPAPAPALQASASPAPPAQPPAQAAKEPQTPANPAPKEAKAAATSEPTAIAALAKPAAGPANATPVSLHAKNSCDIQACSRAYKSFRESDCTYQPYAGPRQLCVSPPATTKEASRADDRSAPVRVHRGNRDVEVQNVPREGARVTDGASSRDDAGPILRRQMRRDMTAEGEDDGIDQTQVIVRRSDDDRGRYGDDGEWRRGFFAPVEDDDDQ